jgi:hypothetical protein
MLHHRHQLIGLTGGSHAAQAPTQGLFGQNVGFRTIGTQGHDRRHVSHVPAFPQHQHRDNAEIGTGVAIQFPAEFSQCLQVIVADGFFVFDKFIPRLFAPSDFFELALEVGVQLIVLPLSCSNTGSVLRRWVIWSAASCRRT